MMPTVWVASEQVRLWGRDEDKAKECQQGQRRGAEERGRGEGQRRGEEKRLPVPSPRSSEGLFTGRLSLWVLLCPVTA